jgi:hypothetical protein
MMSDLPVRVRARSRAAAGRWNQTRCIDPAVATPDLLGRTGNEQDWTQFYWGLTAPGVSGTGEVWTIGDVLSPYVEACPGDVNTPVALGCAVEFTWDMLSASAESLVARGSLTAGQLERFRFMGDTRGVSQ